MPLADLATCIPFPCNSITKKNRLRTYELSKQDWLLTLLLRQRHHRKLLKLAIPFSHHIKVAPREVHLLKSRMAKMTLSLFRAKARMHHCDHLSEQVPDLYSLRPLFLPPSIRQESRTKARAELLFKNTRLSPL